MRGQQDDVKEQGGNLGPWGSAFPGTRSLLTGAFARFQEASDSLAEGKLVLLLSSEFCFLVAGVA